MTPLVHPQSDLATPKASFVLKFVSKFPKKPRFQARKGHKKGGVDLSAVHAAAPQSRGAALSGSEVEKMVEIQERRIVIELCAGDFAWSMGRRPRNQEEFDDWVHLAEKGLLNGHIDWDILYECVKDAMGGA